MRRIILSLILLLGFCSGIYPIYFKHIGMQEGLSQLSVMAIYQDNLGRMWFGTEEGINIYDGVQTKVYKPSPVYFPFELVLPVNEGESVRGGTALTQRQKGRLPPWRRTYLASFRLFCRS